MAARHPVIFHAPKIKRLIIHEDFIGICAAGPDSLCAAALLSILTYWTEFKLAAGESTWIYKTQSEVQTDIFGLFGINKIRANLTWLLDSKYLLQRCNPQNKWDKRHQYQVNCQVVQAAVDAWNGLNSEALELTHRDVETKPSNLSDLTLRSAGTKASKFTESTLLYKNLTTEETPEETLFNSDSDSTVTPAAAGENRDKGETEQVTNVTSLSEFARQLYQPTDGVKPSVGKNSVVVLSSIQQEMPNWNQSSKYCYVGKGRRSKQAEGIRRVKKSEMAKVVFKKNAVGTYEERILRSEKARQMLPDLHGKILVVDNEDEIDVYGNLLVRLAQLAVEDKLPPPPLSRIQTIIHIIAREIAYDKQLVWDKLESDEQTPHIRKAGAIWKRDLAEMDEISPISVEHFEQFVKDYRAGKVVLEGKTGTYFPQAENKLSGWYSTWKARQRKASTLPPQQGRGVEGGQDHQVDDHRNGNPDDPELDRKLLALNPNYFKGSKIDWQAIEAQLELEEVVENG